MSWRRMLVFGLAVAVTTVAVAAPPSSERKSSKKGSSLLRKKSKDDEPAPEETTPAQPPTTAQPGSGQIVIHRQPLHLRAPEKYQVPMHLEPMQTVRVASPFDGVVKALLRKPGQKIETATEIARMDLTAKQ